MYLLVSVPVVQTKKQGRVITESLLKNLLALLSVPPILHNSFLIQKRGVVFVSKNRRRWVRDSRGHQGHLVVNENQPGQQS